MRTLKLGITLFVLSLGLVAMRPSVAFAQDSSCKADCKLDGAKCAKMCKEHAPKKVQSRCVASCKKVVEKCKQDCEKNGSEQ